MNLNDARLPKTFWMHVELCPDTGCWLWLGCKTRNGYGNFTTTQGTPRVHKIVHLIAIGAVPDGWHVDHLCKVRHCCNPKHLEAVTATENMMRSDSPASVNARKTQCVNGHPLTPDNTIMHKHGNGRESSRTCRECNRQSARQWRARKHV